MSTPSLYEAAREVLIRHGYPAAGLEYVGAGEQSVCYGTRDIAVLIGQAAADDGADLTSNGYEVLRWLSHRAADAGVRTPRIRATGTDPRPYALVERANGTLASAFPDATGEDHIKWFGRLGEEVRKTNTVQTSGFGGFVPAGAGYRGRFDTWPASLDHWLAVHLCVGEHRPEDEEVRDLFLAQKIVTERHLAAVEAKIREARSWPVSSVLTHYDNRLDNVVVGEDGIAVLDWGLAFAGIGVAQELIKLFEVAPTSVTDPAVAAFLDGYGLTTEEAEEAVEKGKLMLVLDGLSMSYGWAHQPERREGIRAWLRTVEKLSSAWL